MCNYDMSRFEWRKSSYSGGGNDCVEVAVTAEGAGLRDSKELAGGALWITSRSWQALVATCVGH